MESSVKLAGGAAAVVKVDNTTSAAVKRRPKTTKRKKPSDSGVTTPGTAPPLLLTGPAGVRLDGLTTPGAKSDSGIKLETESVGGGDDSGINMSDTWQRNGHSADFIRQSLDGLPSSGLSSSGPGSAPPPSSTLDNFAPPPPSSFLPQQQQQSAAKLPYPNCGPAPATSGSQPGPPQPLQGVPGRPGQLMDGGGPSAMPGAPPGGFMPQQSQVFVFSTSMANQAAEAVERGLCRTIIDFHVEQPRTRQFLQSLSAGGPHPSQQYVGPPFGPPDGPPPHMGDPAMGGTGPPGDVGGAGDMGGGSALANVELWVQQQNATLQEGPFSPSFGPTSQPMPVGHRTRSNGGDGGGVGLPPRCCPGPHHPGGEFGPAGPGADSMFGGQLPPGYGLEHQHMMRNMAGARVPDENLTPEQLQRREEQLAQLQKIKQMLFPENKGFEGGPPPRYAGCPPPGMYRGPGPSEEMPPHPHMMGQPPQRFMHPGGPGMMVPPGGMVDQPVPPDGMIMMGGMGPPFDQHGVPPNWEMMTNEEREWFRLQQEYYMEQRQKRQIQLQQMAGGQQPPPGFFGDMPRQPPGRTSGPLSPVSPSFNGASPNDPQGYFFPQGQPGVNFPPGHPNFPMNGPGGPPNFNPEFAHHPDGGGFPPYGNPMMMPEPGLLPGSRFPPMCGPSKPKRKRNTAACMPCPGDRPGDDIFRHLQPAPSPQQFCSLNLFDGQELTITKQLNLAYQEPSTSASPTTQPQSSTPPTTAPSRKKKKSNNDVRVKSELAEAGGLSPGAGPSASEAGDLSSDRPVVSPSVSSTGGRSGGGGPITSATLASLARGVESLQDRIQADMLRGGPFGAVQMPEPDEIGEGEERRSNTGGAATDSSRNQRCTTEGVPLQNPEPLPPTSDQSPTSANVKQDPTSALLSPQPTQNDSIPLSGRMVPNTSGVPPTVQSPGGVPGNASVQIELRTPNTIQYLPARPSTSELGDPGVDRCGMPPEGAEVFRQVGPGQFCPNGPGMMPPGFDGPVPPGYNGPMGRFEPVYGEPLSPGTMASRGCGPPVQFPGGEIMFPDGGPVPYSDGPMMQSSAGPVPYHGGRPMFYRGGGPIPPEAGPMYRPGQPGSGMMVPIEFREGGPPDRHGPLMPMGGMPRPSPGGGQMVMMGSGRPVLPPEQPPMPPNPAPARSRNESRSKKSKESKRRAEAAAAARQNTAMCEDPATMMAGRPDQRGPPGPYGGPPGSMPGPPMGFPPTDGPGGMVVDRMRAGPMMMGPDGSPGMMRHPGDVMMMSPEEFEMFQRSGGPPGMMTNDGRMLVHRGAGGMRSNQGMMMLVPGKGGMRPMDGEMMPGGPQMMMPLGPHEMEMRGDPGMMPGGEMRPGSGMMVMNEMRGGPPGMIGGPNEMRIGPGGMMGPREMRPGSGMMIPGELRPGSAAMPQSEGRPPSGMMIPGDMNPASITTSDPHRPPSSMVVMSPRDDGSSGDISKPRQGNGKGSVHPSSDGSRPESVGKRSEAELLQISADAAMRMGQSMMAQGGGNIRPGSKLQPSAEGEMRPNSVAGMTELMDGGIRPGSAAMMGQMDSRGRPGTEMIMTGDGSMRPGSALMMGIGPGDGSVMRPRSEAMMDPMEMAMRPGSDMMMQMGLGDGSRLSGGPVLMNEGGMRPGQDMMGMSVADRRMRPGSAAMMSGMGPASEGGPMMPMNPGDPGMIMMGPGGEGMPMMGMNPVEFDPRNCPPEMMNAQRMGPVGPRMMSPNDPGMRYDGASPMMQMRMNRPRGELDFRMMGGMEPRGIQYGPGIRNGGVYPQDRQSIMMVMGGGGNPGPNPGGPMPTKEFGPGMGPVGGMGPTDGAQFQQFQQQLYATKGPHPQQGPGSPMMMMMDSRVGAAGAGNFPGFDPIQNGPPVRFGPPGSGIM